MKPCSACNEVKPNHEFQKRKASKDGLTAACKHCLKTRDSIRFQKERETRMQRHQEYMKTEAGKQAHKRSLEKWKALHPNRRLANVIFGNALATGKVKRLPCWVCGAKAEAHHPDYSKPLDVVWLCRPHHMQAHALVERQAA